jgi:hypothetical protein
MSYPELLRLLAKVVQAEDEGDRVAGELAAVTLTDAEEEALTALELAARWN